MYFSEEPRKFKDVSFVSDLIEQQQIWVSRALSSFLKQDILTFSEEAKEMKANLQEYWNRIYFFFTSNSAYINLGCFLLGCFSWYHPNSCSPEDESTRYIFDWRYVSRVLFLVSFKDGSWYFLFLRWSRVSLRFPTSGDQRMSHPAPVSGPELITTRQLVAGNYLTYHPNGKHNINIIQTQYINNNNAIIIPKVMCQGWRTICNNILF